MLRYLVAFAIAALHMALPALSADAKGKNDYETLHQDLSKATIDMMNGRRVEGVFIQQGPFTITLDSGMLVEFKPVKNLRVGSYFIGKGTISFIPTNVTERTNLKRFYHSESFVEEFQTMIIATTSDVVTSQLDLFERIEVPAETVPLAEQAWKELVLSGNGSEIDSRLAVPMLNNFSQQPFMAGFRRLDELHAYVTYDPFDVEPYSLFAVRLERFRDIYAEVVRCTESGTSPVVPEDGSDPADRARLFKHRITATLSPSLDFSATDRMEFEVLSDSLLWIDMDLFPLMKVKYVLYGSEMAASDTMEFFKHDESSRIWVKLPSWVKKGDRFELEISYAGPIIRRFNKYTVLLSSITWYPAHNFKQKALFDLTFEYPDDMTLASIGHRIAYSEHGERKQANWVIERPIRNASFHVGLFKRRDIPPTPGIPQSAILYVTPNQIDPISMDVKQTLEFFSKLYGPLPIDSLVATELPGSHGEAFPGLLHLSSEAFEYSGAHASDPRYEKYAQFFHEQFIAHEIAHQWWGISVDFTSYRDRWLSEGFSEYSALLYSQQAAEDKNKFFNLLEEYRNDILEFGRKAIGKDLPPPAIDLGNRAGSGDPDGRGYHIFIYEKGAWVLHMLRNMMLDLKTMQETAFMTTMKTFYTTYAGKRASTEDFKRMIEEITGVSMNWFFDQWVYGNQIPTYDYAWTSEEQADGTFVNKLRIRQKNVDPTFQMLVPIKLVFDDETFVRYRVNVTGEEMEIDLPPSKVEIDELVFNDLMSVLCEVTESSY